MVGFGQWGSAVLLRVAVWAYFTTGHISMHSAHPVGNITQVHVRVQCQEHLFATHIVHSQP